MKNKSKIYLTQKGKRCKAMSLSSCMFLKFMKNKIWAILFLKKLTTTKNKIYTTKNNRKD